MRHMPRRPSPSLPSLSFSLLCICIANASPSLPLPLSLSFPSSLCLSLSLPVTPSLSLPQALLRHSKQSLFSVAAFELRHLLPLFLNVSLSLSNTHTLAVQLLLLEFNSECSTRSALAQCAERKTLDTNLDSRARRSRSDACKLLQARAVTSLSPTTTRPLTSPPDTPLHVLITSLPATVRANMQIARKIQFVNENAIYYSRLASVCVSVSAGV